MKKLLLFTISILCFTTLTAQDAILKRNGEEISAKILEVSAEWVSYKLADEPDGPVRNIAIEEVLMLLYEDGRRQTFHQQDPEEETIEETQYDPEEDPSLVPKEKKKKEKVKKVKTEKPEKLPKEKKGVRFDLGITVGGNFSTGIYEYQSEISNPPASLLIAPAGGLTLDLELGRSFGLMTGVYYKGKGDRTDVNEWVSSLTFPQGISVTTTAEGEGFITNSLNYLEIPFLAVIALNAGGNQQFRIGAGPYVGIGLFGKEKSDYTIYYYHNGEYDREETINSEKEVEFVDIIQAEEDPEKVYWNKFDYGWYFNADLKLRPIILSATASWGRANLIPQPSSSLFFSSSETKDKITSLSFTLSMTYLLGGK
ncbi:MAG: PorT family protein [Bacteroidetes bacterium]|nr:PorT family protein [Bacteroidota bacterium]